MLLSCQAEFHKILLCDQKFNELSYTENSTISRIVAHDIDFKQK